MIDIEWDDLRCLEAIERTNKVGAAARELGMSASTLYRRIAALEAQVGEPCLVRGGDGALTEVGLLLARVGRKTRTSLAEVQAFINDRETRVVGEVSLTTVPSLLPFIQAPLRALAQEHPGLNVSLHLGDNGPSVRDREVDVALAITPRPPAGCWGRRLTRLPYGVFGTRDAVDVEPHRFVVRALDERSSPESAWERVHAKNVVVRAAFYALVDVCAQGVGLGLMPRALAARHPQLVEVPAYAPTLAGLERSVWLLTHPDRRQTPRIAALMEALGDCFTDADAPVAKPKRARR
jgi:DNA-binding transcriptional LysR family regulator